MDFSGIDKSELPPVVLDWQCGRWFAVLHVIVRFCDWETSSKTLTARSG